MIALGQGLSPVFGGGRGGVVWTPAKLFENGELGAWYDPSDLSTLFRDTAGTVPVTADGQTVGLMRDKSGNGLDLTQAISSARPKWIESSPHLQFDGVDDRLFRSVFSETVTSMGLAIVSQQSGANETDVVFGAEETVTGRYQFYINDSRNRAGMNAGSHSGAFPYYATNSAQTKTVSIQNWDGSTLRTYTDGVFANHSVISGSIVYTSSGQIYLGGSPSFGGNLFTGDVYGALIRATPFSADEISQLNEWLSTK